MNNLNMSTEVLLEKINERRKLALVLLNYHSLFEGEFKTIFTFKRLLRIAKQEPRPRKKWRKRDLPSYIHASLLISDHDWKIARAAVWWITAGDDTTT